MTRRNLLAAFMSICAALAARSFAQTPTASPKSPNTKFIAEQNARQILLVMDADKDGRISKKEWMDFMSKEFDRLDKDHNGYVDQKELLATSITMHGVPAEVQGK